MRNCRFDGIDFGEMEVRVQTQHQSERKICATFFPNCPTIRNDRNVGKTFDKDNLSQMDKGHNRTVRTRTRY